MAKQPFKTKPLGIRLRLDLLEELRQEAGVQTGQQMVNFLEDFYVRNKILSMSENVHKVLDNLDAAAYVSLPELAATSIENSKAKEEKKKEDHASKNEKSSYNPFNNKRFQDKNKTSI